MSPVSNAQIIAFPLPRKMSPGEINPKPKTIAEVDELVANVREAHVESAVKTIAEATFHDMAALGFVDIYTSSDYVKDSNLVTESIRSVLLKIYGMEHPLQEVAANLFEIEDEEEDGDEDLEEED